jgi:hypothetical protein
MLTKPATNDTSIAEKHSLSRAMLRPCKFIGRYVVSTLTSVLTELAMKQASCAR